MKEVLDKIQKDFFELYNNVENSNIKITPNTGNTFKWSTERMFDLTPFHIERARGNLRKSEILDSEPKKHTSFEKASFLDNQITCIEFWDDNIMTGFSNFEKESDFIQELRILCEDEDELRIWNKFIYEEEKLVRKESAFLTGASIEDYKYIDDRIVKIIINKRVDYIDEIMDTEDGITNADINTIVYDLDYKNGTLDKIIGEGGKNILK